MLREHALLIEKKQREKKVDLSILTTYPEYYILKEEMEKMIFSFNNNENIDLESKVSVTEQVLANRLAKEKMLRFLSDLGVYSVKATDTLNRTYE